MAKFCLIPEQVQKFKKALKDGTLNPEKLAVMTSAERRAYLETLVGKDNGVQVNGLFESKLLLKNQKAGYISWAKKVGGISKDAKRDLISRIEKMDKVLNPESEAMFLEDLAATRLGFGVSETEAKTIFDLSNILSEAETKLKPNEGSIEYGAAKEALSQYLSVLKGSNKPSALVNPLKGQGIIGKTGAVATDTKAVVKFLAQNTRAFVASFDNSLWGNQGIRVALDPRYSKVWAKNFAKSFIDIAKVLTAKPSIDELLFKGSKKGDQILSAVRTEIYGRKNSINGRYEMSTPETSKLDLGGIEEEFPTSLPARIPVIGRLFRAAEIAYEAGAMRLRADIADKIYATAEKQGINMLDKFEIGSRNTVINSITGRGRIKVPDLINEAAFSVKFTKSQVDFLTVNAFDKLSPSARKEAGKNILGVVASTAVFLGIAKALDPNSTDFDPRSPKFGKIEKDGITLINLTPGYGSILTLVSRIMTQSTKNRAGIVTPLGNEYGQTNGMDIFWDFTENKASPLAAIIRDMVRQKNFEGDKPTPESIAKDSLLSISLDSADKILKDKSGDSLLKAIAIGLGVLGTGAGATYYPTKWEQKTSLEMTQFKEKVGQDKFETANKKFNEEYDKWFTKIMDSNSYKNLSDESKQSLITKAKDSIKQKVFKKYRFKYKTQKKDKSETQTIKNLVP